MSQARQAGSYFAKAGRRDPELYVLLGVMSGVFGLAGWYFGSKPTSTTSEAEVAVAHTQAPWQGEGKGNYKYKYHPNADPSLPPKEAPSALHSVIVPNVTLSKEMHDKYNKWGKEGF